MKKILIVSTVSRQFYLFEKVNIEVLKSLGYEIHAAANYSDENERLDSLDIIRHNFDIERSPFSLKNIKAYRQLKNLMKSEKFNAVHCHSPMGGVLARLAAKAVGISNVIYTAHGFHFYKGAPILNWLLYYPVEKFLSIYTNTIITINKEDYKRAQNFKAKNVLYVSGIGVNYKKFSCDMNNKLKRKELGIPENAIVLLSVGELNKNKNHEIIIRGLKAIKHPDIIYVICGQGTRKSYLEQLAKSNGTIDNVRFLGYRNDLEEIYKCSDIFIFPSFREGLSVSLMEAMAAGLPVVCSKIRGNTDLIFDGKGGYLIEPKSIEGYAKMLNKLVINKDLRDRMGKYNSEIVKEFDVRKVRELMHEIYIQIK